MSFIKNSGKQIVIKERKNNMSTIILAKETTIHAEGKRHNGNCKPVICVTNGKRFSSILDAAEYEGICYSTISNCCTGKTRTANGKVWKFAKDRDCIDALANTVQEKLELFDKYYDVIAGMEAIEQAKIAEEIAEEKRRLEEEKRQELIAKAKEKYARREKQFNKAKNDFEKALIKLEKAEAELQALAC